LTVLVSGLLLEAPPPRSARNATAGSTPSASSPPAPRSSNGQSSSANASLALSNRGVAYEKLGQLDRAMADFNEAIRRDSTNPHPGQPGKLYLDHGDFERALADYDRDIQIHPNNPFALGHRADAYFIHGDPARAIQRLRSGDQDRFQGISLSTFAGARRFAPPAMTIAQARISTGAIGSTRSLPWPTSSRPPPDG